MRVISLFLLALALASCTAFKPGCIIQNKMVDVATNVVTSKLECKNSAAVKADMEALVENLGLCKSAQTGTIADVLCPPVVSAVVTKVASVVPSAWDCSATAAKATLAAALTSACRQIPVSGN